MKDYFNFYVIWPYKDFIKGVKNLFYFFSVVWKWRAWDYSYSLKLLQKSLQGHKKAIDKYSNSLYKEDNELGIVNELLEILDRIIRDRYDEIVGIQYDNMQFNFVPIKKEDYPEDLDFEEGMSTMEITFLNGYTKELHDKLRVKAQKMHDKDLKRFGELMSKVEYIWY